MTVPSDDELREAAVKAVADLIARVDPEGGFTTRFVLLVEAMDVENGRVCWMFTDHNQTAWDTLGLIDYARAVEYAAVARDELE